MNDAEDMWQQWQRLLNSGSADPLEVAQLASTFERYFDTVKTEAVKAARASGHSWEELAQSLGTTRQSAWERYRRLEKMKSSQWLSAGSLYPKPLAES